MNKELKQKAEDFIINRYKIAECYREDNAETRKYMRMDVHSQYEREYQLYLDATKELQEDLRHKKIAIRTRKARIKDLKKQMKKFDEGCNIIEELSKFINDCKWYSQHGYEEKQKELIEKVNNFLKE